MRAPGSFCRRADDEEFFIKKREETEIVFRNWQGDQRQVIAAIKQSSNHFLSHSHGDANLCIRKALTQFPEGAAKLVNQSGDTGGEVEGAHVFRHIVFELLLNVAHQLDYLSCVLGKTRSRG